MADLKHITPSKLLWLDMEMTGLRPDKDRIVEVAIIITDWDFQEMARFESGVGQDRTLLETLFSQNLWTMGRPKETRELIELSARSKPEKEVEAEVIALVDTFFAPDEPVLLAGNSIHQDRQFIRAWWPHLEKRLHYRMLDVSAWKVVMQGKYGIEYKKQEKHRALGDIQESIEELRSYLERARF